MSKDNIVSIKKIIKTSELYGVDPIIFKDMKYIDVLQLKIELANTRITELLKIYFMERDTELIKKISRAIKFNEELLKEVQ